MDTGELGAHGGNELARIPLRADQELGMKQALLRRQYEHHRFGPCIEPAETHVLYHTDDLRLLNVLLNVLAQRLLARPELLHEALVDDDLPAEVRVLLAELPATQDGNSHPAERTGTDVGIDDHARVVVQGAVAL